jgi:hypothetical protein
MNKILLKMAKKFEEAGGSIKDFEAKASKLQAVAGNEGQDVYGPLIRMMSEQQEKAKSGVKDVYENSEGKIPPEVMAKIRSLSGDERKEYIERAVKAGEVGGGNLTTFSEDAKKAHSDHTEAQAERTKIKDATTSLTAEATNRGSIYTHDIHLERILLNILAVLQGEEGRVELADSSKDILAGGTGMVAGPLAPGSVAGELSKAAGMGDIAVDKSANFMSQYGGKSLNDFKQMSADGEIGNDFLKDLDASSMSESAKEGIYEMFKGGALDFNSGGGGGGIMEALMGGPLSMMANMGKGADSDQSLSEAVSAMDGDFMKTAVSQAVSEITTGSAASSIATQMMAIIDTSALTDVTDIFSKNIGEFGAAMGSPLNIEVGGTIEVNVNMSGAEFLKDAGGALAEMAGSAASKAINNFIGQMNKSSNVKAKPDWADSGQSGPITGGGKSGPRGRGQGRG